MRKANILPIALMAFALVGFLFVLDYSISDGKWPWSTEKSSTTTTTNTSENVNVEVNTNTSSNTNATQEILPSGVERYTSVKLGVTFTYLKSEGGTIQEIGDTIYVGGSNNNPIDGQFVRVLSKEPSDTLTQAIKDKFLVGIDPEKCYVRVLNGKTIGAALPDSASVADIAFPINNTNSGDPWFFQKDCPAGYSTSNGLAYFWMDTDFPGKFLFFSIGQYSINGLNDGYKTTWQQTLRIAETNPTAGWKTYTNKKFDYTLRHPITYTASGTEERASFDQTDYANGNVAHLNVFVADGTNDDKFGPSGDGLAVIDWITAARNGFPTMKYMTNKRTTTIHSKKFVTFDYDLGGSGGSVLYFYTQGSTIYVIQDWPGGAGNPNFNPLAADRILSTFTFTK